MKVVLYEGGQPVQIVELDCKQQPRLVLHGTNVYLHLAYNSTEYHKYEHGEVYVLPPPTPEPSPSLRIIYPDGHESKTVYAKAGFLFEVPSVRLVAHEVKADRGYLCGDDWAEDDDDETYTYEHVAAGAYEKPVPSQASPEAGLYSGKVYVYELGKYILRDLWDVAGSKAVADCGEVNPTEARGSLCPGSVTT